MRPPTSCLILGSGLGGLALGGLLARAGVDVTVLEAHPELLGGCAQTLTLGDYKFAAGPRYLWNFGPGQIGRRFLDKCGLADRVPLVELDRAGFDHVYVGADEPVRVPNGWDAYEELLKERFPAEARGLRRFFALCRRAFRVFEVIDAEGLYLEPWGTVVRRCLLRRPAATAWLLVRPYLTLHQVFDACGLGDRVRAVLSAHGGIFALPAGSLSFHAYAAGTLFYHRGCYYPRDDMEGFVGALVGMIEKHGGRVLRGQRVVAAEADTAGVRSVRTAAGERFAADVVAVNFDPRTFLALTDLPGGATARGLPAYAYSPSVCSLFLGVNDADILRPHFGNWNVWYNAGPGADADFSGGEPRAEPRLLYLNSPTLVKRSAGDAPPGHATLTAFAPGSYAAWTKAGPAEADWKAGHTALLIDLIGRRFAPGLKGRVAAACLRTPLDKERAWLAPGGTIYGRSFAAREVWKKVPYKGLLPNLYFVGAYVSFAGVASVIHGACRVYEELTGDRV
jgi:phytoene dehydrogenase-like protein